MFGLILCPIACKAVASLTWLLDTHSSGRIGSPSVTGSISRRRSSSRLGSLVLKGRRPLPARRTCPDRQRRPVEILQPPFEGAARHSRRPAYRRDPPAPRRPSLGRRKQAPAAFIHLVPYCGIPLPNCTLINHAAEYRNRHGNLGARCPAGP